MNNTCIDITTVFANDGFIYGNLTK